jgi:integrase
LNNFFRFSRQTSTHRARRQFHRQGAAERAGVNAAASIHWLRHAHASHAIDNGTPITLVSATLGHTDLKATSVYAQCPTWRKQRRAVQLIAVQLNGDRSIPGLTDLTHAALGNVPALSAARLFEQPID